MHARAARKPRAVVHFLGGALAGAAPQVAYHLLLERLAEAGLTVVATPYRLTFRHLDCARAAAAAFDGAVAELRAAGRAYLAPPGAPVVGVGHSNGALLHLLLGALPPAAEADDGAGAGDGAAVGSDGSSEASTSGGGGSSSISGGSSTSPTTAAAPRRAGNVLISYNNKQVSDAVPIPGLLDGLRPTVNSVRGNGGAGGGGGDGAPEALLAALAAALPPGVAVERRLVAAAVPAVEQLGSVLDEVGGGTTEFTPPPAESRALIAERYRARRSLLVQFEDDGIDESGEMLALLEAALAGEAETSLSNPGSATSSSDWAGSGSSSDGEGSWSSIGGVGVGPAGRYVPLSTAGPLEPVRLLRLPGTHLTPCGADVDLGPAAALEAFARARADSQADVRRLAAEVAAWAGAVADEERALRRQRAAAAAAAQAGAASQQ